jgi:hypothetical protein
VVARHPGAGQQTPVFLITARMIDSCAGAEERRERYFSKPWITKLIIGSTDVGSGGLSRETGS